MPIIIIEEHRIIASVISYLIKFRTIFRKPHRISNGEKINKGMGDFYSITILFMVTNACRCIQRVSDEWRVALSICMGQTGILYWYYSAVSL